MIILATPCTGKTQFAKNSGLKVLDTEQNHFAHVEKNGEVVKNDYKFSHYIQHLLDNIDNYDYVVTPWDRTVANVLQMRQRKSIAQIEQLNSCREHMKCHKSQEIPYSYKTHSVFSPQMYCLIAHTVIGYEPAPIWCPFIAPGS